jgi:metallophosphoesterase (TIGR00282 family)
MRLLFCGDVVGRSGREVVCGNLPRLRDQLRLDFVVVNGENAAGGFGITEPICRQFYQAGVDAITTGNHVWDRREIIAYIDGDPRLLRPDNYPAATPGRGIGLYPAAGGRKVMVINVMGRLFMDPLDDPFAALERALERHGLKRPADAIVLDVHAEATSEKQAIAHRFDGRVSLAVGTHSHVPTADTRILAGGTAFQTDAGMCGDYDSVIGMQKSASIARFIRKMRTEPMAAAEGEATLCAVYVETDDANGLARYVAPLRLGGGLAPCWPA